MPLAVKGEKPQLPGIARGISLLPWRRGLRVLISTAVIAFSFAFLGYQLYKDWAILSTYSWEIHLIPLLLSFLVYTLDLGLVTLAWNSIMGRLAGFSDLRKNLKIYWSANLGKLLPGTVWYIAGRAYLRECLAV